MKRTDLVTMVKGLKLIGDINKQTDNYKTLGYMPQGQERRYLTPAETWKVGEGFPEVTIFKM